MVTMPIELYTDGSAVKNPGAAGYGYIIRYYEDGDNFDPPTEKTIEFNQGYRLSTNNRMEIMAALNGIQNVINLINNGTLSGAHQINLMSDSEYLCNAVNRKWLPKWQQNNWMTSGFQGRDPVPVKNKDLWEQMISLQNTLSSMNVAITFTHVKGHAGHEWNEKADKLATEASGNSTNHIIDEIYEQTMLNNKG